MAERPQSYKNHVRFFPPFHIFVIPVLLLNAVKRLSAAYGWRRHF